MTLPTTRRQALAEGSPRYFTGEPCVHGHCGPRYTSIHRCVECYRINSKNEYEADRQKAKDAAVRWREANPERFRDQQRRYQDKKLAERQQAE